MQIVFPQEEECAGAANARSVEESAIVEQAHSGWAQADCSAVLLENDSAPAVVPAGLWAVGSIRAEPVLRGWAPVGCSAAL